MKPQKQSPQFQKDNQAFTNSINPVEKEGMTSKADFFSSDSEEENKASDEKEEGEISDSDSC